MGKLSIQESRDFVVKTARENIEKVKQDNSYIKQAQVVNTSLGVIVAMERNAVMLEAINKHQTNLLLNEGM